MVQFEVDFKFVLMNLVWFVEHQEDKYFLTS